MQKKLLTLQSSFSKKQAHKKDDGEEEGKNEESSENKPMIILFRWLVSSLSSQKSKVHTQFYQLGKSLHTQCNVKCNGL